MTITTTALGNNVKVNEFIKNLNSKLTQTWRGQKFDDIVKVHNHIGVVTEITLNEFGIEGLKPSLWGIKISDIYADIFHYEIDYSEDKRYKRNKVGTINKIKFAPHIDTDEQATIDDLIRVVQKHKIEGYIENVNKHLANVKEKVEQGEKELIELKSLLRKFE